MRRLFSDNGTNFVGAEKEMRVEISEWNEKAREEMRMRGVEWTFNPPLAAHRGGAWERLIKSAKKHLAFLLQQDNIHVESLGTVLAQTEYVMNSRPITYVGEDAGGEAILSPMDFLCPGVRAAAGDEILPPSPPDENALRYTWRQSRALVDGFWKRWSRDYVAALQARPKWREVEKNLAVDDVVLLVDEQCRRGDWKTGRIVEVGDDDIVRTVKVRTADGKLFSRDRTKVVRLELDPERVQGPQS